MEQAKKNATAQNSQKIFCKQPISCPWITSQPYQSTLNKNRTVESSLNKSLPSIPLSMESRTINDKTCPSLQHSSSQFFYFLRLMQLFPETHPATLHTVLNLCKNDFFCAVDKLLYAKRCKALYNRSQNMFKRCSSSRNHPYCGAHNMAKNVKQQERTVSSDAAVISRDSVETLSKIVVDNSFDGSGVKDCSANSDIPKSTPRNEIQASETAPSLVEESSEIIDLPSPFSNKTTENPKLDN